MTTDGTKYQAVFLNTPRTEWLGLLLKETQYQRDPQDAYTTNFVTALSITNEAYHTWDRSPVRISKFVQTYSIK